MTEAAPLERPARRRRLAVILPLAAFLGLAVLFAVALRSGDPSRLPSALVGKPVPDFALEPLEGLLRDGKPVPGFGRGDVAAGKVTLINVWASWCIPCREEHPLLTELAEQRGLTLLGLNYKDGAAAARRFLGANGNPFTAVGVDANGRTAIDFGVYGVPETFVIDGQGRIAYKHVGPLTEDSIEQRLMPAIAKASSEAPGAQGAAPSPSGAVAGALKSSDASGTTSPAVAVAKDLRATTKS